MFQYFVAIFIQIAQKNCTVRFFDCYRFLVRFPILVACIYPFWSLVNKIIMCPSAARCYQVFANNNNAVEMYPKKIVRNCEN